MKYTRRCLFCSDPLQGPKRTSTTCGSCGNLNLREDLRIFRTLRAGPRRLEWTLKAATAIAIGGFTFLLLTGITGMHGYAGVDYAIGAPMLFALVLWDTLGLITRRHSILRMEIFWPAFVGAIALAPTLVYGAMITGVSRTGATASVVAGTSIALLVGFCALRIWRLTRPYKRNVVVDLAPSEDESALS